MKALSSQPSTEVAVTRGLKVLGSKAGFRQHKFLRAKGINSFGSFFVFNIEV